MRIICPQCASHYDVDGDKIGAEGQLVRCSQCREVWQIHRADDHALQPMPVEDAGWTQPPHDAFDNAPIDFRLAKARLRRGGERLPGQGGLRGTVATIAIGLLTMAATAAALSERDAVARRLPMTAALYSAVGVPVNPEGLALRDVHSALVAEGDKTVLMLQGTITNLRNGPTNVPNLAMVVRDSGQEALYSWTAPAPKASLAQGETIAFRSRLAAPPASGKDVKVSFAAAAS